MIIFISWYYLWILLFVQTLLWEHMHNMGYAWSVLMKNSLCAILSINLFRHWSLFFTVACKDKVYYNPRLWVGHSGNAGHRWSVCVSEYTIYTVFKIASCSHRPVTTYITEEEKTRAGDKLSHLCQLQITAFPRALLALAPFPLTS